MTERVGFTEVLIDTTRKVKRIPQSEYLASGQIPIIDQSQEFCAGYYAEFNDAFEKVPAIVFGDHTRCVKYVDRPFVAGADGVKVLLCKRKEDNPKYFYYALKAANVPSLGYSRHFKLVKALTFADATRERQEVIVARLDSLEQLITERHAEIDRLDDLVKSRFVEMFSVYNDNADRTLQDFSELVTVGIANAATHAYADTGVVMLRNLNVRENHLDDSNLVYIKPEFAAKYRNKALKAGDILVTRTGYPGIACLVPEKYEGCQTFTTLIVRLKRDAPVTATYVSQLINSPLGKDFVRKMKAGSSQQNFGATSLKKMPIGTPPLALQQEFAAFVQQVDKSRFVVRRAISRCTSGEKPSHCSGPPSRKSWWCQSSDAQAIVAPAQWACPCQSLESPGYA